MTRRPQKLNSESSIEVQIEELVLHGLPLTRNQGSAVQDAVQIELARILKERGLHGIANGSIPHLSTGPVQLIGNSNPAHLSNQIAHAIYGGFAPSALSPRQAHSREGASR